MRIRTDFGNWDIVAIEQLLALYRAQCTDPVGIGTYDDAIAEYERREEASRD